jgi:hypothetical protein
MDREKAEVKKDFKDAEAEIDSLAILVLKTLIV